jgi:hypothetical protein
MTRYGRLGASGQTTVKDEGDEARAIKLSERELPSSSPETPRSCRPPFSAA